MMLKNLLILFVIGNANTPPKDLEERVLQQRKSIHSAVIEVESTVIKTTSPGDEKRLRTRRMIFFDETRFRLDFSREISSDDAGSLDTKQSFDGTTFIRVDAPSKDGAIIPAVRVDKRGVAEEEWGGFRFEPRVIGMVPNGFGVLYAARLNSCVGNPSLREKIISESSEEINERLCYKIDSVYPTGVKLSVWIDPEIDCVIRIRQSWKSHDGKDKISEMNNWVSKDPETGIWFPNRCILKSWENDKLVETEETTIKTTEINAKLDKQVFSLAGMEVPAGRRVSILSDAPDASRYTYKWDGKSIVRAAAVFEDSLELTATPVSAGKNIALVVTSIICAALSVLVALKWFNQRRRAT